MKREWIYWKMIYLYIGYYKLLWHIFHLTDVFYLCFLNKQILCRKAEGYPSGNYTLENKLLASKYIAADNHWQLLANCTEVCILR